MGRRKKEYISLYLEQDELEKINEYCLAHSIDRNSFIRSACNLALEVLQHTDDTPKTVSSFPIMKIPDDVKLPVSKQHIYQQLFTQLTHVLERFLKNLDSYSFRDDEEKSEKQDFRMSKGQKEKFVATLQVFKELIKHRDES